MNERIIPSGVRREIERQETPEFVLYFLTISHESLSEKIRVVSDPEKFTISGNDFTGFDFKIQLLTDDEGMPGAQLSVQNADKRIGEALLRMTSPARLQVDVVAGSQFDLTTAPRIPLAEPLEYVYQAKHLYLIGVKGDLIMLTGNIVSWDFTQEIYPGMRATQNRFPGLFR